MFLILERTILHELRFVLTENESKRKNGEKIVEKIYWSQYLKWLAPPRVTPE